MTFIDMSREEIAVGKNGAEWGGGRWKTGGEQTFWQTGLHNADTCMGDRRYLWYSKV